MLRKISRDVAIYGSGDLVLRIVGFLVFPIYAHVFSVQEFGVFALITTMAGVVTLFSSLGLSMATTRYYWDAQISPSMRPAVVSTGLIALSVWSIAVVLLVIAATYPAREIIASRYGARWTLMLLALLAIVPEQILQYCLNVLRLHFSPWKFTLISFFKNVLGIAVGLVLIFMFNGGLEGLFWGALAGAVMGVPVALAFIRHELTATFHLSTAKWLISFGYPFIFAGLAYWIFGSVDRWMLAELSDTTQVGLYSIAYKFAGVLLFVNTAFGQAWSPIALKLRRDDAGYRKTYSRILSVWSFVLVMGGSTIALFGSEVLYLLTPGEYWAAAPALAPLAMGIALSGTTQITAIGISLENKTRLFASAAWITALANVILNFLLIPHWGALGASVATFLSYALLTYLYLFWSQRLHPIPLENAKLLYSAVLAVAIAALCAGPFVVSNLSVTAIAAKIVLLAATVAGGVFFGILNRSIIKELRASRDNVHAGHSTESAG